MKTATDFETMMRRVGETIDELNNPSINPNYELSKDEIKDVLNEVYDFFGPFSYVVDGRTITDIEEQLAGAIRLVEKIQDETMEDDIKGYATDALEKLDYIADPLLENIGVDD